MNQLNIRTVSLIIASAVALMVAAFMVVANNGKSITAAAIFSSGFLIYLLVNYIMHRYINQRLKVVYRSIHNKEKEGDQKKSGDTISKAGDAVKIWESEKNSEIEQLKRTDHYRKEFVANVTHELKTPLFNIQGYIHSLIDGAIDDHEVNRIFLDKASKNVDRLASLIYDLETITQLETGGAIFQAEIFDLNKLIAEAIDSLEIKADIKRRKLELVADKIFYANADREKIQQVIINLLENSIKYGIENGITKIQLFDVDENVLIEVADDGPGIAQEHLLRLFERFYRVDKSRSRDAGGTGLGLAIVKHIIEGHGKTVNVRSELGKGTVFSFSLEKK
jgi:two-component system phosphate regulon sensor histidine kinase PhoR